MGETRKLAAILVSDVVGFSRLAGADEDRILARLRVLRSDLIGPAIAAPIWPRWTCFGSMLAAGPAWANNVFDCQDVGMSAPEPIGDQEGHALLTGTFSCRLTAGPMAGGRLTGTIAWEMNNCEGTLISGTGVIRKPGSLVVYKDTEGALKLTMDDKGQVTGFTVSGAATWVFASGDAAPLKGEGAALDR
jgi:hypothetical protein